MVFDIYFKAETILLRYYSVVFYDLDYTYNKTPKCFNIHNYTQLYDQTFAFFVKTCLIVSWWPSETFWMLLWPLLFGEWCSGIRLHPYLRWMQSNRPSKVDLANCFMYYLPTSQHGFPLNHTYKSYHSCVCSLIINRSLTLLFSCYMCYNLAHYSHSSTILT